MDQPEHDPPPWEELITEHIRRDAGFFNCLAQRIVGQQRHHLRNLAHFELDIADALAWAFPLIRFEGEDDNDYRFTCHQVKPVFLGLSQSELPHMRLAGLTYLAKCDSGEEGLRTPWR